MNLPDFSFEKRVWQKGFNLVAGVDEVGRGSFAGPVVAGCVIFAKNVLIPDEILINDSKRLRPKQREISAVWIKENAFAWAVGEAPVGIINRLGIKKASEMAFRRAIVSCGKVDYLLIDAFYIPYVKGLRRKNQMAIVKGDTKSLSIAAASIVAKVYRDKLMQKLGRERKYKKYAWSKNKGYGTGQHRSAIAKYGPTRLHRKTFIKALV